MRPIISEVFISDRVLAQDLFLSVSVFIARGINIVCLPVYIFLVLFADGAFGFLYRRGKKSKLLSVFNFETLDYSRVRPIINCMYEIGRAVNGEPIKRSNGYTSNYIYSPYLQRLNHQVGFCTIEIEINAPVNVSTGEGRSIYNHPQTAAASSRRRINAEGDFCALVAVGKFSAR